MTIRQSYQNDQSYDNLQKIKKFKKTEDKLRMILRMSKPQLCYLKITKTTSMHVSDQYAYLVITRQQLVHTTHNRFTDLWN